MTLLLIVLGAGALIEGVLYLSRTLWGNHGLRRVFSGVSITLTSFATAGMFAMEPTVIIGIFTIISLLRIVNVLRISMGRMNDHYLYRVARQSSVLLLLAQLAALGVWVFMHVWSVTAYWWAGLIAVLQLVLALVLFAGTVRRIYKTRIRFSEGALTSDALPTVTVAIPARNETDDLEACLHSLVQSDYPKLEILVLDDCSQLKRTPAIIRDFAHAGVRFIKGDVPDHTWLAKNNAYDKLAREANGEIILFCGVDIRFEQATIRQLVQTMLLKQKRMMSVLPLRHEPKKMHASITQAARYVWEMSPPRRLFNRPAVLSSCWLIYRNDLAALGGFASVRRAITPEALFARHIVNTSDGYSFVRSEPSLGLSSAKSINNQRHTAVRTRYPSLHRRPENVLLQSMIHLVLILGSFVMAGLGLIGGLPLWITVISLLSALLFTSVYGLVSISTKVNSWYLTPLLVIPAIVYDVLLMYRSMWLYEFSEVLWKGRNVCLPVMHVYPSLPKV